MMKNKRFKYIAGFAAAVVLCSASCGTAEITREKETVDFKEYFEHYDEMMGNDMLSTGYTSYDVREMESQIDGFWDYYERYEKAQQDLIRPLRNGMQTLSGRGHTLQGAISGQGSMYSVIRMGIITMIKTRYPPQIKRILPMRIFLHRRILA